MQTVDYIVIISRWVHIIAAVAAVGGAVFQRYALFPAMADALDADEHLRLREAVRQRWARFVHACIALLLLTGGLNFYLLALAPKVKPMPYHALFGIKFLAAMAVFFLAAALAGRSMGFEKYRQDSRHWLGVVVILAVLIVLLSGVLYGIRTAG